jgi:hypothetical protein
VSVALEDVHVGADLGDHFSGDHALYTRDLRQPFALRAVRLKLLVDAIIDALELRISPSPGA